MIKENNIISSRRNKKYKGSFCQTQNPSVRESNSNDVFQARKDYKTHHKTTKVSVNLTKTEEKRTKDPFVTAITLNMKKDEKQIIQIDKSITGLNNSQLLSNKMLTQTKSVIKPTPFQSIVRHGSKEKVKTSLEIYSKTLRHTKGKLYR